MVRLAICWKYQKTTSKISFWLLFNKTVCSKHYIRSLYGCNTWSHLPFAENINKPRQKLFLKTNFRHLFNKTLKFTKVTNLLFQVCMACNTWSHLKFPKNIKTMSKTIFNGKKYRNFVKKFTNEEPWTILFVTYCMYLKKAI